jgi:predicted aminopeptidase
MGFDPKLAQVVGDGYQARHLLAAQEAFSGALVEEALRRLDGVVASGELNGERALAFCAELSAYRRILARLRQQVVAGERAADRMLAVPLEGSA